MTASNPLLAGLVASLSSNDSGIFDLKQQVAQLNNTGSAQHHQLMEQIANLLEKQNDLLQQQVDAKVRDEKMLAELEAAKERDLETHRLQKQTVERLIVAQQRVDSILVQNYEVHEYSIPRLFVILPDSYESWDPRNFLKERFRLFFLCECGENCEQGTHQGTIAGGPVITTANAPIALICIKNRIHLAKHEGYELSRPAEFFDRYGPCAWDAQDPETLPGSGGCGGSCFCSGRQRHQRGYGRRQVNRREYDAGSGYIDQLSGAAAG